MTTRCRLQTTEKSSTESPVTQPSSLQQRHSAIFSLLEKSSRRNEAGPPATTIKNALLPFRTLMNNSLTPTTSAPGKLSGLPLTSYQGKFISISPDYPMACESMFSFTKISNPLFFLFWFFFRAAVPVPGKSSQKTGNESRQQNTFVFVSEYDFEWCPETFTCTQTARRNHLLDGYRGRDRSNRKPSWKLLTCRTRSYCRCPSSSNR